MTTRMINEQDLEKQMPNHMLGGCIPAFFNIFDRNHLLCPKRLYTKRLPDSTFVDSASDSASSLRSPVRPEEFERPEDHNLKYAPSPEHLRLPATPLPEKVTNPLPIMYSPARASVAAVSSPWKFSRDAPRLSLDSQAVVDAKGKLRPRELRTTAGNAGDDDIDRLKRSPSVVARLMGLDQPLPSSELPEKKSELRKSASGSRSRDAYRFVSGNAFPPNQQYQSNSTLASTDNRDRNNSNVNSRLNMTTLDQVGRSANTEPAKPSQQRRIGFYDAGDYFPEPKRALAICSEIEKSLKMRGFQESSQDLEMLKQIFEALQLKGLLHSNRPPEPLARRNFVYEPRFPHEESPILVMKTARSPRRVSNPLPGFRSKAVSHRIPPNPRSPARIENKSTSPVTTRRRLNFETQRRKKQTTATESIRVSSVQSSRIRYESRRIDQVSSQSPRLPRSPAEIGGAEDESFGISGCSIRTRSSSHTDTERVKREELKEGESLLERCDKLLNSIAELHRSPVSVLDSAMYKDQEESSPSPVNVIKRSLDFKDRVADFEEETLWTPLSSGSRAFQLESPDTNANNTEDQQDPDFVYVSEILRVSNYLPEDSDMFLLLEKQQSINCRAGDTSRHKRKLIFDSVIEMIEKHRQLPPWESASSAPELRQIWSELQEIQVRIESEDLFEVICGVMKRDMARDGWAGCPVEMSEAVLDIERLIFKDLVGETIHNLAAVATENGAIPSSRRKLVF